MLDSGNATVLRGKVGVVAIGRNEGNRLRVCLKSLLASGIDPQHMVYVDSGSTDDSVALARSLGLNVVELDAHAPFTAARARNAGFDRLMTVDPQLMYVQFIDGDCEIADSWMGDAATFLDEHPDVAIVCGRRRERHPEQSVYNRLCDIDWDGPTGSVRACGGDSMMRRDAFKSAGGFRSTLIAGEEPELCVRMRQSGWKIYRLSQDMCLHDAAMRKFGQWWLRNARAGHASAEGAWLHGGAPERHGVRPLFSSLLWGLVLPSAIVLATVTGFSRVAVALALLYPLQVIRIASRGRYKGRVNWEMAVFLVLGKFAEVSGNLRFLVNLLRGRHAKLIEYK